MGGLEECESDLDPVVVDAMPEYIHRAPLVELLGEPVAELLKYPVRSVVDLQ